MMTCEPNFIREVVIHCHRYEAPPSPLELAYFTIHKSFCSFVFPH